MIPANKKAGFEKVATKERRLLTVEVVEAKGVIASSKAGSDPYVLCALTDLGGREIKAESFRTKTLNKTVNPKWEEKFTYGRSAVHTLLQSLNSGRQRY